MKDIPDGSIDMILCDLPYGTTSCKWDIILPFDLLWEQYHRIIKDNGAIVLFGSEPFSSHLRMSNIKNYKYDIIWQKDRPSNFMMSKKQILKMHENISIFYKKQPYFNPQKTIRDDNKKRKLSGNEISRSKIESYGNAERVFIDTSS
jgi:site-specific DNA-methyltransferase (adenine-specific)